MILTKDKKGNIINGTSEIEPTKHLSARFYIGVDPDVKLNGFAVYDKRLKKLIECRTVDFFGLIPAINVYETEFTKNYNHYIVKIEGGWLRGSVWHGGKGKSFTDRIARNVGENHQAGKKIIELCIEHDFPFEVVEPKPPIFAQAFYFEKVTGWKGSTNADARSAARYVYGF